MTGLASYDSSLFAAADRYQSEDTCEGVEVEIEVQREWIGGWIYGRVATDAGSLEGVLVSAERDDGSVVDLAHYTLAQRTLVLSAADAETALEQAQREECDADDYFRELAGGKP